jgi:hypothetical protein
MELLRRTTNVDMLARFMIQQEFYIRSISKLVADNFRLGLLKRTDGNKSKHVDEFLGMSRRGHQRRDTIISYASRVSNSSIPQLVEKEEKEEKAVVAAEYVES